MIVYVDVDSVCADLESAWLARYNADYGDNLTPDKLDGWDMTSKVKPECGARIYQYLEDPALYDAVEPIKDSLGGVTRLREMGHRVVFATSSPNGSAGRKLRWLLDHGYLDKKDLRGSTHPDYIELHDKGLLRGDVLIDDGPHNVEKFHGYAILFRAGHNRSFAWPVIAEDWNKVVWKLKADVIPPGTHPTELHSPHQARAFREIIEAMYQTHLIKNMDYSTSNIAGAGSIGIATRLWDKVARMMNLVGFRIEIASSTYDKPRKPNLESLLDTFMDLSVYGIIAMIYDKGAWGK